jgi:hypothetical protein
VAVSEAWDDVELDDELDADDDDDDDLDLDDDEWGAEDDDE